MQPRTLLETNTADRKPSPMRFTDMTPVTKRQKKVAKAKARTPRKVVQPPVTTKRQRTQKAVATAHKGY